MATDPRTKKLLREIATTETLVKNSKFKSAENAIAFSERRFDSVFRALPEQDKSRIAGRILDVKQSIRDGKAADLGKEQELLRSGQTQEFIQGRIRQLRVDRRKAVKSIGGLNTSISSLERQRILKQKGILAAIKKEAASQQDSLDELDRVLLALGKQLKLLKAKPGSMGSRRRRKL